jgi:hypothetical protein
VKICSEFGALGLLLYSSLRNLTFFDLERKMIDAATAREASGGSRDIQPQPLDFIRPVMLFFLNTIMEYCVHDVEEILADLEDVPEGTPRFTEVFAEMGSSLVITPLKDTEQLKDETFLKGFSAGTASTAASDSILAPSIDNSVSKKEEQVIE